MFVRVGGSIIVRRALRRNEACFLGMRGGAQIIMRNRGIVNRYEITVLVESLMMIKYFTFIEYICYGMAK